MPTVRTPLRRGVRVKLTPQVIEAYRHARKLCDASDLDRWGCRSDASNLAQTELHEMLGRGAGDLDIMDTIGLRRSGTKLE